MSETPEIVERVARAICIESGYEPEEWAAREDIRNECRRHALGVVNAMGEARLHAMIAAIDAKPTSSTA